MLRIIYSVCLTLVIIAAPASGAQKDRLRVPPQRQGEGLDGSQSIERLQKALNLTADQVASLRPMMESHQQNLRPLAEDMRDKAEALRDLQRQPNPDTTAVGNAVLALKASREKMTAARQEFETSFGNLLTPDQKTKLEDMKADMKAGARSRRSPGRPGLRRQN